MKKFVPVLVIVVVLAAAAGGYYYYINSQKQQTMVERQPASSLEAPIKEESMANGEGAMMEEGTQPVEVEAFEYSYSTKKITVKAGEKVSLKLTNTGKMSHNLVVEDTDIKMNLVSPGTSDTVEFTIDQPGEYTFYCSVPGHRAKGMEGTLVVE